MIIDGTTYEYDIMILPNKAVNTFRTKVGHAIQLVDIKDLIVLDTYEAVRMFNKLPQAGFSACFHLNC